MSPFSYFARSRPRIVAACLAALVAAPTLVPLGGCRSNASAPEARGDHDAHVAHDHVEPAASYKAGHGVRLTAAGAKFIELKTGEVASRSFAGRDAAAIPADALLRTIKGDFVYVANGDSFLRTPVKVGRADASHIEITDGLYEGDTIVTRGVRALSLAEIQALNGGVGCADGH